MLAGARTAVCRADFQEEVLEAGRGGHAAVAQLLGPVEVSSSLGRRGVRQEDFRDGRVEPVESGEVLRAAEHHDLVHGLLEGLLVVLEEGPSALPEALVLGGCREALAALLELGFLVFDQREQQREPVAELRQAGLPLRL